MKMKDGEERRAGEKRTVGRRAEAGNGIPSGPGGRALAHTGAFVLFVCDLWCNSIIIFIYLFILLF